MPEILKNYSLRELNSFHFDVRTDLYCECRSIQEVQELINDPVYRNNRTLILGEGSNVLFSGDFAGLLIRPMILGREIIREDPDHVWIRSGAGENWDEFVAWTTAWGYGGIENLSLIPGSVGSSPIQNIGAYGVEVGDFIEEVSAVDSLTGQKLTFLKEACRFAYRDSIFKLDWKNKCIITSVIFRLSKNPTFNLGYPMLAEKMAASKKQDIETLRKLIIEIRRSKLPDPDDLGNAGSFFKNPVIDEDLHQNILQKFPSLPSYPAGYGFKKIPAAWLIEQCEWKGKRIKDAGCYEKHALVLVNHGDANGQDILALASRIESDVLRKFGIELQKEVNII